MTNQAAQTMPVIDDFNGDNAKLIESARALISLSDSGSLAPHGIGGHARAILSAFIVRTETAALSQTAGVASLQQWERTSMEVLAAALRERGDDLSADSASWLEKWLAAASASGAHPDALPDGTLSKSTAKRVEALASASVSERARDERFTAMLIGIIADVQDALGFTDEDKECSNGSLEIVAAIRELQEQALTQQRGEPVARVIFTSRKKPDVEWLTDTVKRDTLLYTTPQPSADAVRELVAEWKVRPGVTDAYKICADELESLLSGGSHA